MVRECRAGGPARVSTSADAEAGGRGRPARRVSTIDVLDPGAGRDRAAAWLRPGPPPPRPPRTATSTRPSREVPHPAVQPFDGRLRSVKARKPTPWTRPPIRYRRATAWEAADYESGRPAWRRSRSTRDDAPMLQCRDATNRRQQPRRVAAPDAADRAARRPPRSEGPDGLLPLRRGLRRRLSSRAGPRAWCRVRRSRTSCTRRRGSTAHGEIEPFGLALCDRLLASFPRITRARVEIAEQRWSRLEIGGKAAGPGVRGRRRRAADDRRHEQRPADRRRLGHRPELTLMRTAGLRAPRRAAGRRPAPGRRAAAAGRRARRAVDLQQPGRHVRAVSPGRPRASSSRRSPRTPAAPSSTRCTRSPMSRSPPTRRSPTSRCRCRSAPTGRPICSAPAWRTRTNSSSSLDEPLGMVEVTVEREPPQAGLTASDDAPDLQAGGEFVEPTPL